MATKFYKCNHCGNVIEKIVDKNVPVVCCGEKMQELIPNTVEASGEKHIPVVTQLEGNRLRIEVGSVHHPMLPEPSLVQNYILQPAIRTTLTGQRDFIFGQKRICLTRMTLHTMKA